MQDFSFYLTRINSYLLRGIFLAQTNNFIDVNQNSLPSISQVTPEFLDLIQGFHDLSGQTMAADKLGNAMKDIFGYLTQDHARCMDLFDLVCDYVEAGSWKRATEEVKELASALHRHMHIEEELIFTAMLKLVNSPDVPTAVMRTEHARLSRYIDHLSAAVSQQHAQDFLKFAAMFRVLLQLHFDKEHGRFYPLAECVLAPHRDRLNAELASLKDSSNSPS